MSEENWLEVARDIMSCEAIRTIGDQRLNPPQYDEDHYEECPEHPGFAGDIEEDEIVKCICDRIAFDKQDEADERRGEDERKGEW